MCSFGAVAMAGLTANQLEAQHGPMLKSALCGDMKMRELFMYLTITKKPSVKVTEGQHLGICSKSSKQILRGKCVELL